MTTTVPAGFQVVDGGMGWRCSTLTIRAIPDAHLTWDLTPTIAYYQRGHEMVIALRLSAGDYSHGSRGYGIRSYEFGSIQQRVLERVTQAMRACFASAPDVTCGPKVFTPDLEGVWRYEHVVCQDPAKAVALMQALAAELLKLGAP